MKPSPHRVTSRWRRANEINDWLHRAQSDDDEDEEGGDSMPTDTSGHPYPSGGQRETTISASRVARRYLTT